MKTNEQIIGSAAIYCIAALVELQKQAHRSIQFCVECDIQPTRHYRILAAVEDELSDYGGQFVI